MINQIKTQLKQLKLSGMYESLDFRIMEAQNNQLSYSEFLTMILRDEIELRLQRKLVYLTRRAGITNDKTLENFDFSFNPSINAVLIRELSTCHFVEQGMNIFFFGPAGVGKTHLAKALAHCACRKYLSVAFFSFQDLFHQFAKADLDGKLDELLERLTKTDLIIVDDFAFKKLNQQQSEYFYTLVNERSPLKSFIFTSNRALSDWINIFPDPIIANSILDRIAHNAYQITLKGESYRKKFAPK